MLGLFWLGSLSILFLCQRLFQKSQNKCAFCFIFPSFMRRHLIKNISNFSYYSFSIKSSFGGSCFFNLKFTISCRAFIKHHYFFRTKAFSRNVVFSVHLVSNKKVKVLQSRQKEFCFRFLFFTIFRVHWRLLWGERPRRIFSLLKKEFAHHYERLKGLLELLLAGNQRLQLRDRQVLLS